MSAHCEICDTDLLQEVMGEEIRFICPVCSREKKIDELTKENVRLREILDTNLITVTITSESVKQLEAKLEAGKKAGEALVDAKNKICGAYCPNVKKSDTEWTHSEICKLLSEALTQSREAGLI